MDQELFCVEKVLNQQLKCLDDFNDYLCEISMHFSAANGHVLETYIFQDCIDLVKAKLQSLTGMKETIHDLKTYVGALRDLILIFYVQFP